MLQGLMQGMMGSATNNQAMAANNYYNQAMAQNLAMFNENRILNSYQMKEQERLDMLARRKEKEIELIRTDEGTKELYDAMIEAQNKYKMWIELKLEV